MTNELDPLVLNNGLVIRFIDQSNRYFGDFHRIYIRVRISLPDSFALPEGLTPETACLEIKLEKMGVPTDSLVAERKSMIEAYLLTSRTYLEKDGFPLQLSLKLQQEKRRPVFLRNQCQG